MDCGTSCVTCCAILLEPQLLDIIIVPFRNEKVSNQGSIPITIDCNVAAFIVFAEGFHQPIKRTKQKNQELVFLERPKRPMLDSCLENTLAIPFVRFHPRKGNPPPG
ncbi:hypothetical protein TNCV_695671 [Trichonephila clavipes]|nr:hypothetical protein TNCV_695671 [Trichonephila clavipes]